MPPREFTVPLPARMRALPVDSRGFPVPWFVAWFDGAGRETQRGIGHPDFRVVGSSRLPAAVKFGHCWICGDKLGSMLAFVIGPMCAINRTISEPPSHYECAHFAARCCPFLANPRMRRNEKGIGEGIEAGELVEAAGLPIDRNPGVACLWMTRSYRTFRPHAGAPGILFELGEPARVEWYANGKPATREEVDAAIRTGLPLLRDTSRQEGTAALAALDRYIGRVTPLLPAAPSVPLPTLAAVENALGPRFKDGAPDLLKFLSDHA